MHALVTLCLMPASFSKVSELIGIAYSNSLTRLLGSATAPRQLPGHAISFNNRVVSNSGARSVTVTTRDEQHARMLFTMASRIIVRKPLTWSGSTNWVWGFPRVYWFQPGSKSKGKGGLGFHSNRLVDFSPSVYSFSAPSAEALSRGGLQRHRPPRLGLGVRDQGRLDTDLVRSFSSVAFFFVFGLFPRFPRYTYLLREVRASQN